MKKINLPVIVLKGIILLPNNDIRLESNNKIKDFYLRKNFSQSA